MKLYKLGSIAFILLGFLHLTAHFMGGLKPDSKLIILLNDMNGYKIQLLGEHSLLKFHNGFSIMMGFLLSSLGVQNLIASKSINKNYLTSSIVITGISLMISVLFFHLLAIGFISFSFICYILSIKKLKS